MSDRYIMAWFIEAIGTPVMYCVISVNSRPIFIYMEFGDQKISIGTSLTRMLQGFMVGSQGAEFGK